MENREVLCNRIECNRIVCPASCDKRPENNDKANSAGVSVDSINIVLSLISPERHAELDAKLDWLRGKTRSV
jgi:hypothetical protein